MRSSETDIVERRRNLISERASRLIMRPDSGLSNEVLMRPLNLQIKYPILTPNLLQRLNTDSALRRLKPLPNLKVPNRNPVIQSG